MAEHLDDIATYVSGEDTSELAKVKAELAYALSALDREMELCRQVEVRLPVATEIIRPFAWYFEVNDCVERSNSDVLEVPIRDLRAARKFFDGEILSPIPASVGSPAQPQPDHSTPRKA